MLKGSFFGGKMYMRYLGVSNVLSVLTFLMGSLAATVVQAEPPPERTPRVINGTNASAGAFPWMVALLRANEPDSTEAQFCGGTLIGQQHILTAAHCVAELNPSDVQVLIGEQELPFGKGARREIRGYKIHPLWNRVTLENDLAIIKLMQPVSTQPIAMAHYSDKALYDGGALGSVLGWGQKDPQFPLLPTVLQEAKVPIQTDKTCLEELGRWFKPNSMMCAGVKSSSAQVGDGVDTCYGDSGGPLILKDINGVTKQVGVTSWGFACANDKTRGVYAEVAANEGFVFSFPDAPPFATSDPTILMADKATAATVGQPLTCSPGTYAGDPVLGLSYKWYRVADTDIPIKGATFAMYVPINEDANRVIKCSVIASNGGGQSQEEFSEIVSISDAPAAVATATPTDGVSTEMNKDKTGPNVKISQKLCKERICKVLIVADDVESGILSVTATLQQTAQRRCTNSRVCSKTQSRPVQVTSITSEVWTATFRVVPRAKGRVLLTVSATDKEGNTSSAVLKMRN